MASDHPHAETLIVQVRLLLAAVGLAVAVTVAGQRPLLWSAIAVTVAALVTAVIVRSRGGVGAPVGWLLLLVDAAATGWAVAHLGDSLGHVLTDQLWILLLLPAAEGALLWAFRGTMVGWGTATVLVHALSQAPLSAGSVIRQAAGFAVAVMLGRMAVVSDRRVRELRCQRHVADRRAELLHVVADVAGDVNVLDPDRVLEAVTAAAQRLGFDVAELASLDQREGGRFRILVRRGFPLDPPTTQRDVDAGLIGLAHRTRHTVRVDDYAAWDGAIGEDLTAGAIGSGAATPVMLDGEVAAVLVVATRVRRTIDDYELDCLTLLGTHAAVALRNARQHELQRRREHRSRHVAMHDQLTGVANRLGLEAWAAQRPTTSGPLAAVFVDLDGFKPVNDSHGHAAGDAVLRSVAEHVDAVLREEDLLVRYGGDEFVVLLDDAPEDLAAVAARIRRAVATPVHLTPGTVVRPACSIGLAVQEPGVTIDELLSRADRAMYVDKRGPDGTPPLARAS